MNPYSCDMWTNFLPTKPTSLASWFNLMFRTLGERKSKPTKIVELKNIIVYLNLKMTSVSIKVIVFYYDKCTKFFISLYNNKWW
jgi:hypothetical protein